MALSAAYRVTLHAARVRWTGMTLPILAIQVVTKQAVIRVVG